MAEHATSPTYPLRSDDNSGRSGVTDRPEPIDRMIARIASRQRGVIGWHQMLAAGISQAAIAHRIATGRLHRLFRGVYLVGHAIAPELAPETAALIVSPPGTLLSHHTGGGLWQMAALPRVVDVTVLAGRPDSRAGLRVHTAHQLHPRDRRVIRGLPVTSPARTLVDLAAGLSRERLERCYEQAQILRLVTPTEVLHALERAPRRRGVGLLRDLVIEQPTMTRSKAERRLLRALAAAGIPRPETNVKLLDHEVDMLWREARVVVECDGFETHRTRAAFERDRRRDAELQAAGYRVLRATWRRLTGDAEQLATEIAATLRHGLSPPEQR
jgi:very-short-patch-repair endonuclease